LKNKIKQNQFFLISFLPAIAYWYLESKYDVKTAAIGGMLLAGAEILIEKIFIKKIHGISKFNFILLLLLGGVTLIGNDGIWFKLQPMFTGLCIGGYLLYKIKGNESLMLEMMEGFGQKSPLPPEFFLKLEAHMAILMIVYGLFMGSLAVLVKTSTWLFFKTIGFYIIFFIFMIFEFIFMRKTLLK